MMIDTMNYDDCWSFFYALVMMSLTLPLVVKFPEWMRAWFPLWRRYIHVVLWLIVRCDYSLLPVWYSIVFIVRCCVILLTYLRWLFCDSDLVIIFILRNITNLIFIVEFSITTGYSGEENDSDAFTVLFPVNSDACWSGCCSSRSLFRWLLFYCNTISYDDVVLLFWAALFTFYFAVCCSWCYLRSDTVCCSGVCWLLVIQLVLQYYLYTFWCSDLFLWWLHCCYYDYITFLIVITILNFGDGIGVDLFLLFLFLFHVTVNTDTVDMQWCSYICLFSVPTIHTIPHYILRWFSIRYGVIRYLPIPLWCSYHSDYIRCVGLTGGCSLHSVITIQWFWMGVLFGDGGDSVDGIRGNSFVVPTVFVIVTFTSDTDYDWCITI